MKNENMKRYTTYNLEGTIKEVVYPKDIDELIEILKKLKNKKHMVLGNGSNVVFVGDYDGTIIKLDNFNKCVINKNIVKVESGYSIIKLAIETANLGLSGLEFASGIPGTVGGCIYGNAGAYNTDIASILKEITVLTDKYEIIKMSNSDMNFSYRYSILKENKFICLDATFELEYKSKEEIIKLIKDRKERRVSSQPLDYPSAGSVFRNPEGDYAGRIIESLGFKGKSIGDAFVSEKHANFIVNKGRATGKDIKKLVMEIKEKVKEKYNIDLTIEQEFIE